MCTNYVSSLVQDSNAKVLSHEQKFKHANIGTHWHTFGTCAPKLVHTKLRNKKQTMQPRYPQCRQQRAIAQQSLAIDNKGNT